MKTTTSAHHMARLILGVGLCLIAVQPGTGQTRNAADGPWSGWAQCDVVAQFNGQGSTSLNQQTHTWMLTGATPTAGTDIKVYPATWTVTGGGSSQRDQGAGRTVSDKWVTAGRSMPDTITDLPAGSQSWLIAPYWDTPDGRAIDASTGLRVTATIAPWTSTPGPAPAGIKVQAFPNSDVIKNTCSVSIAVTWAPVPGATGYTVYGESGPISSRIPLTSFSFFYRQAAMKLSDLFLGAVAGVVSDYANSPQFKRGVQIRVAASFVDRPDGLSAAVPYTFSTYPCWDGRNFPSDP